MGKQDKRRSPDSDELLDSDCSNFEIPYEIILLVVSFIHIGFAPLTKVEESFNLQAIHDILYHGSDIEKVKILLNLTYSVIFDIVKRQKSYCISYPVFKSSCLY
jgi:hypothetical protein